MPGRILTLQRQVRELGRLRAGLTETATTRDGKAYERPMSSKTWILTSANRNYLDAAAALWGGEVLEWQPVGGGPKAWRVITQAPVIDAILPPGDPLSQHLEMWSRGGCQRRCDGEVESRSEQPCLCRAEFGDDFHEQRQGTVCDIHTRLNVFLPDLPDIGVWRVETKGFWPANHMAGYIDMIKGQVGPQVLVPVRLGIEPRTRVADGKTSHYIEIVVSLRTQASFGQILASPQVLAIGGPADSRTIDAAPQRTAIESGRRPGTPAEWRERFAQAATLDELRSMWTLAGNDGALDDDTRAAFKTEGERLLPASTADAEPPTDGDDEPDAGADLWAKAIDAATTVEELRAVWADMRASGVDDKTLNQQWWARKSAITGQPLPGADATVAETEPDRDMVWSAIMAAAGTLGWNTDDVMSRFQAHSGQEAADGTGWDYADFLDAMRKGAVQ